MPMPSRKHLIASLLAAGAAGALAIAIGLSSAPAHAQLTVFDPGNYSQNILTAARALNQINNQIRSLQNEATMILNQTRNLARIDFPQLQAIAETMRQIDLLMTQARGIQLRVSTLDEEFREMFPTSVEQLLTASQQATAARARLDASMDGFRHAMTVQAQVTENIATDTANLTDIVSRSQSAEGSLQVGQATNQLLALVAKQQFQLQQMMAAQFRSQAIEQARRAQAEGDARAATTKFLGAGHAYTPR